MKVYKFHKHALKDLLVSYVIQMHILSTVTHSFHVWLMIDELWSLVHKTQMVHPMENPQILARLLSPSTHMIIVFIVLPTINSRAEKC
jgi:hypothetical protein